MRRRRNATRDETREPVNEAHLYHETLKLYGIFSEKSVSSYLCSYNYFKSVELLLHEDNNINISVM